MVFSCQIVWCVLQMLNLPLPGNLPALAQWTNAINSEFWAWFQMALWSFLVRSLLCFLQTFLFWQKNCGYRISNKQLHFKRFLWFIGYFILIEEKSSAFSSFKRFDKSVHRTQFSTRFYCLILFNAADAIWRIFSTHFVLIIVRFRVVPSNLQTQMKNRPSQQLILRLFRWHSSDWTLLFFGIYFSILLFPAGCLFQKLFKQLKIYCSWRFLILLEKMIV